MDKHKYRPGGGASFFFIVLTIGLLLSFLGITVGGGLTFRVPTTKVSFSIGASLGKKQVVRVALPAYLSGRVGDNSTFINQSTTVTIWVAEGIGVIILGEQPEAPPFNLSVNFK